MRTLTLGDCDHYASPYMRGMKQATQILGHEHAEVSIRMPAKTIEQRLRLWEPTVIFTHMVLWPPVGSPLVGELIDILERAARRGAKIVIHDGDAKAATRHPQDISSWCSLALVNHAYDRSAWKVNTLRWPYFAPVQDTIAAPVENYRCELFFAGTLSNGPTYAKRTALLESIRARGVRVVPPSKNSIDETAEIAASADAVLGFGRPEIPGWVDTRVFQYPGAGGILLHDDAQGYLEPWVHYVPYRSGDADSVVEALAMLRRLTDAERMAIRTRAFEYVQANHSSVARAHQVFAALGVA